MIKMKTPSMFTCNDPITIETKTEPARKICRIPNMVSVAVEFRHPESNEVMGYGLTNRLLNGEIDVMKLFESLDKSDFTKYGGCDVYETGIVSHW